MSVTKEKLSQSTVVLTYTVPHEKFVEAREKVISNLRRRARIPGFRPGKAPRRLVENYYGKQAIQTESLEQMMDTAVREEQIDGLTVFSMTMEEFPKYEEGKDIVFSVVAEVFPEVELQPESFTGIKVKAPLQSVTEEMIQSRIDADRRKQRTIDEVTGRALKNGDTAELDYAGTVDGVAFDGGTAEAQELVIGSHSFISGFEEQMVGMEIGEERDLNVTFPEDYASKDLAGKDAVFHVKLLGIKEEKLPELNDDFVQDISEFDTVEEYRENIRRDLEKKVTDQNRMLVLSAMADILASENEVDIPEALLSGMVERRVKDQEKQLKSYGMDLNTYLGMYGLSREDMENDIREECRREIVTEALENAMRSSFGIEEGGAAADAFVEANFKEPNETLEDAKKRMSRTMGNPDYIAARFMLADRLMKENTIEVLEEDSDTNTDE